MTRILIVDDHPIFRQGLAMVLSEESDLEVCGEGASAAEAVVLVDRLDPDIVLLDLSMPGGGLAALEAIRREHAGVPVAVLTASESPDDVMEVLRAGAQGYILKGIGSQTLIEAVRDVARGHGYVAPVLAARILSEICVSEGLATAAGGDGAAEDRGHLLSLLTPREEQVLRLVASGYSNKQIALEGAMQEKTVKHHMTRILQKLNVRNRTEAAMVLTNGRTASSHRT